jgi:hypothetical protein
MNSSAVKLFLALLWLVPGVGFLIHDVWTGQPLGFPFGQWRLPLAVPCLILAALNFARWWSARSRAAARPSPLLHHRRPRRDPDAEPDPAFRFDDPPPEAAGRDP